MPDSNAQKGQRTDGASNLTHEPLTPLTLRRDPNDESPTIISKAPVHLNSDAVAQSIRGRKLAHFELLAPIGVGGMAAVLKARDLHLDRTVALKILPPDMANDNENIKRFHQEARAAAKLDHENIARVFYCGEDQGLQFIAFEFVQGDNLRTVLERRHKLPVGEAIHYLIQIASGLAHAAGRGVVHRDIKPSNIIVTATGRAKLVDMGLARNLAPQQNHDNDLTQPGVTLGTFDYISPEQAIEPRDADVRSDIYSLGCTFYHLLTGHPPVPEGTPAKKLHHHQHVPPIDPRELSPTIPDEVALILSRMMAKNPSERYSRPEQIVQHLLRVAHRLEGISSNPGHNDAADGVVMVDAPLLHSTTPTRPLLLGAVALACVVTLVLVFTQSRGPQRPSFSPTRSVVQNDAKDKPPVHPGGSSDPVGPVKSPGSGNTGIQSPASATFTYTSAQSPRDIREFLRKLPSGSEAEILLAADLVLPGDGSDDPGLAFKGRKITIRAHPTQLRPTIWFAYDGSSREKATEWAALLLEADEVTLQGLRIIVDARESQLRLTGVLVRGGRKHLVEDCQFIQTAPAYREDQRLASLVFDATTRPDSRPVAQVRDCTFVGAEESESKPGDVLSLRRIGRGGQDALTRFGPVQMQVSHCAFGPHLACVRLEGLVEGTDHGSTFDHCSALLAEGSSVFQLANGAGAQVRVNRSLFSRAGRKPTTADRGPVLIREMGEDSNGLIYQGDDNRYYNLEGFWVAGNSNEPLDWDEFQTRLSGTSTSRDERSQVLTMSPSQEADPLALLGTLKLAGAFRPQDRVRELRTTANDRKLVGVERCAGVSYVHDLPVLEQKNPPLVRKEKTFDPSLGESGNGQYKTLQQAIDDSRNAGPIVILVKANGVVSIEPVRLERASLDITIKPAPGCRPVLVPENKDRDGFIFYVQDGKLSLEKLAFKVQPTETVESGVTQSVVSLQGEGSCKFVDCVVTLAEPRGGTLAVAMLADPSTVMMKKPSTMSNGPKLAFENCLIRGKGDGVWCRSSRAFRVEMSHSLVALTGSLVNIEGPRDEGAMVEGRSPVLLDMKNVTTCLNEHLLHLRGARDLKSFTPMQCKATNCLFTSLAGKTLVHLEGMETTEDKLKERLTWEGSNNVYGNFQEMLDQKPSGTEMRPPSFGENTWKTFSGESDARFAKVKFSTAPETATLSRSKADQFKTTDVSDIGATLEQIPTPPTDEPR